MTGLGLDTRGDQESDITGLELNTRSDQESDATIATTFSGEEEEDSNIHTMTKQSIKTTSAMNQQRIYLHDFTVV